MICVWFPGGVTSVFWGFAAHGQIGVYPTRDIFKDMDQAVKDMNDKEAERAQAVKDMNDKEDERAQAVKGVFYIILVLCIFL